MKPAICLLVAVCGIVHAENGVAEPSLQPKAEKAAEGVGTPAAQALTNSLGMKFMPVPITGGPSGGRDVWFCVWETRVQDFQAFVDATQYDATKEADGESSKFHWKAGEWESSPESPVSYVTWDDAKAFCEWLTQKERQEGKISATQSYRLPTDHEWSCAVGIGGEENPAESPKDKNGKIAVFPWGGNWPPPNEVGNYDSFSVSSVYTDRFARSAPVGSFSANAYGLYDLGGNVGEWCEDAYKPGASWRVLRGASWSSNKRGFICSSGRNFGEPTERNGNYGFRCVLDSAP